MPRRKDELESNAQTQDVPEPNGEQAAPSKPDLDNSGEKESEASSDQAAPSDETSATTNLPALTTKEMAGALNVIYSEGVNVRIRVGDYLIDNVFKGNIKEASSRNPRKNNSYSELAKSSDLEFSDKELGICLRVAVLERVLKEADEKLCDLKFSVKREIIKLPKTDQMLELARVAYGDGLTVEQTREKVQAMMSSTSDPDWGKKILNGLKNPWDLVSDKGDKDTTSTKSLKDVRQLCSDKSRLEKDLNKRERTDIRTDATKKLVDIEKYVALLKDLAETLGEIDAA